jgi:hypothetical protein
MIFPDLPSGPADLPGQGKLLLCVGIVVAAITFLLGSKMEFLATHFESILLTAAALAVFGLIFIFMRSKCGSAPD